MRPMLAPGKIGFRGNGGGFGGGGFSFEAESETLFAAMSSAPSDARKLVINDLILALKNDGIWTKLGLLYVLAAHDSQAARLNWIDPSANTLTLTSAPTFTADRGYQGDGVDDDLRPGINSDAIPTYLRDSAHFSAWSRTVGAAGANVAELGDVTTPHIWLQIRNGSNNTRVYINRAFALDCANTSTDGHFLVNRSGANDVQVYRNGASIGSSGAIASVAFPAGNAVVFMNAPQLSGLSTKQMAAYSMGGSLDATETADFYTDLSAYMTAVGA